MMLTQEDFEDALHEQTKLFGGAAERFRNAIKLDNKLYPERGAARASNQIKKEAHMLERIAALETIISPISVSQADVRRYTRVARWDYVHQAHGLDKCGATFRPKQHSNSLIVQGAAAIRYFDDLTRRVFIEDADLQWYGYTANCPRCVRMRAGMPARGVKRKEAGRKSGYSINVAA